MSPLNVRTSSFLFVCFNFTFALFDWIGLEQQRMNGNMFGHVQTYIPNWFIDALQEWCLLFRSYKAYRMRIGPQIGPNKDHECITLSKQPAD